MGFWSLGLGFNVLRSGLRDLDLGFRLLGSRSRDKGFWGPLKPIYPIVLALSAISMCIWRPRQGLPGCRRPKFWYIISRP